MIKSWLFWRKIELGKRQKAHYYREVVANQGLSRDELEELNWVKCKDIINYAYEHVPFYRRKYSQAGLCPDDIKSREDFVKIPITSKHEIRKYAKEMISDEASSRFMVESTTGGSTGEPVKVFHDSRFHYEPLLWRMMGWWDISPEMNSAYVLRLQRKHKLERWANAVMWWPTLRAHLDASLMSERDMKRFIEKLCDIRPKLLQGYVGSVYQLALFIEVNSLFIPPPKAIWVTSSPISSVQRSKIERIFGAPVYDQYGCGEIFALAAQCGKRNGLHVFWDARFIEFVDSQGLPVPKGDYGEILITDLENRVFPLIRYKNGDVSRFLEKTCSCGLAFPLIDSVKGRTTDCISLPDGSKISGDYLTTIFDNYPDAVRAFQIQQDRDYSIRLLYVPSPESTGTDQAIRYATRELEKRCGSQANVFTQVVSSIPHDRGKLRFVISMVEHK